VYMYLARTCTRRPPERGRAREPADDGVASGALARGEDAARLPGAEEDEWRPRRPTTRAGL